MLRHLTALVGVVGLAMVPRPAHADEDTRPDRTMWGMGAKVRRWYAPPALQELFVDETPGLASNDGAGIDFARRTGDVEIVFGFGFDRLDGQDGYYVEKGGDPTLPGHVDFVTFHDLQLFSAEVVVVSHVRLHRLLELRFGGGIGLGLVRGEMRKTDAICASARVPEDCMADPAGVEIDQPADLPPVLPVLNLLAGLELVPFDFLRLFVDVGVHSAPYVGGGLTLYLW